MRERIEKFECTGSEGQGKAVGSSRSQALLTQLSVSLSGFWSGKDRQFRCNEEVASGCRSKYMSL